MRRILSVLIMLLLLTSCWDSAWRPVPLYPTTPQNLFRSSIQSANNRGHGYFILSVPAAPGDVTTETTVDGEIVEETTHIDTTYARITIGLPNEEDPDEFYIEAGLESVLIKSSMESDEPILSSEIGENGMASFRFDWTYSDNLWKLKSGDIQIIPDIILEDGGNIYITPMLIVESSEDFYDFPDGLRLDIIKNYFEN